MTNTYRIFVRKLGETATNNTLAQMREKYYNWSSVNSVRKCGLDYSS